jgi:putative sterol carrier protein
MQAAYDERAAAKVDETYEFRVGAEVFHARVQDGAVHARHGPAHEPDLVITATVEAFVNLVAGQGTVEQAAKQGRISADGSGAALRHCSSIFKRPQRASAAAT